MAVCWHLSPVAKKYGIVGMKLDGVRILQMTEILDDETVQSQVEFKKRIQSCGKRPFEVLPLSHPVSTKRCLLP